MFAARPIPGRMERFFCARRSTRPNGVPPLARGDRPSGESILKRFRRPTLTSLALIGTVTLGACAEQAPTAVALAGAPSFRRSSSATGDYMILGAADALPDDLEASVAAAGGLLIRSYPELGLAVARATEAGFADRAARISGVESVTEDRVVQLIDPN